MNSEKQFPRLKRIHSDATLKSGIGKYSYEYWKKQPIAMIVMSLQPGSIDALKVKPDGRIMDGTRIKVLEERGYDVDVLPREEV